MLSFLSDWSRPRADTPTMAQGTGIGPTGRIPHRSTTWRSALLDLRTLLRAIPEGISARSFIFHLRLRLRERLSIRGLVHPKS